MRDARVDLRNFNRIPLHGHHLREPDRLGVGTPCFIVGATHYK